LSNPNRLTQNNVAPAARTAITKNFGTGSSMLAKIICETMDEAKEFGAPVVFPWRLIKKCPVRRPSNGQKAETWKATRKDDDDRVRLRLFDCSRLG